MNKLIRLPAFHGKLSQFVALDAVDYVLVYDHTQDWPQRPSTVDFTKLRYLEISVGGKSTVLKPEAGEPDLEFPNLPAQLEAQGLRSTDVGYVKVDNIAHVQCQDSDLEDWRTAEGSNYITSLTMRFKSGAELSGFVDCDSVGRIIELAL